MRRFSSYENKHFTVEITDEGIIVLARSAAPFASADDMDASCLPVQLHLNRLGRRGKRILVDTRLAVGNNDPAFERQFSAHRQRMVQGFAAVAILVQTPVGRLQNQRLAEKAPSEAPAGIRIFMDFDEAVAYLQTAEAAPESLSVPPTKRPR